jgi:hypothetical protein
MAILLKTKVVEFRDGSSLTVSESSWNTTMRLAELEEFARANPLDDPMKQMFREEFYPKLAACSSGDVPDEETARNLPDDQLDLWYSAVREINPRWFATLDRLAELGAAALEEQRKKKSKSQTKSSSG